ncbi:lanthionine synthetase LanC family protein [Puia sp. P3]|uniref:lanthionine synthetase LanC family protein n=1 Tax=Puia sp. P3 TaxID=3423952 RepID=UPI003D67130A
MMSVLQQEGFVDFDIDREFADLDESLFNMALHQMDEDFIDYLHGAIGVIHYFTCRKPSPDTLRRLDQLIGALCDRAVRKDAGYWFRNYLVRTGEEDYINFGLSHGLSGILLILLNAYRLSVHKDLIEKVVREGIRFIRKYKMDIDYSNEEYSFFPTLFRQEATEITAPNRLGWCYGDLNQVLLFYRAGEAFGDRELTGLADLIGAQTLMRKDQRSTLVVDSSFCHGASGLAQFYRQLYAERSLLAYKEAYEYWTERTLIYLEKDMAGGLYDGKEHQLLDGLVGVGFSLLSYISDRKLGWSRSLLL